MNILKAIETTTMAVKQKYGPNYTVTVIEDVPISKDHGLLIVSVQNGKESQTVLVNLFKTNRGYTIQLFEKVYQSFLPS